MKKELTIKDILNEHGEKLRSGFCGSEAEQIKYIIQHYEDYADKARASIRKTMDDMIVFLRAISIYGESVAMGATHSQKQSRLSGLMQLLENRIEWLQRETVSAQFASFRHNDVFKGNYPYHDAIWEARRLREEIDKLKKDRSELSNDYDE